MFLCEKCGRLNTPNHHFEFEINDLVRQYQEENVYRPMFEIGNFEGRILGCHVGKLDMIRIHAELHYDGQVVDEEYCQVISEEKAKYIVSRLKNRLEAMVLLRETKKQCVDVCRMILDKFRDDDRYHNGYCSILENGWNHLSYDALNKSVQDKYLTKSQIRKIQAYAEKVRKGEIK